MNTLTDILTTFPNCRVTISSCLTRRKPRVGDRKLTKKHGWMIRRRQTYNGMGCSRNGRPVYEWVAERHLDQFDLDVLRNMGRDRGGINPYSAPTTISS